MVHSGGHRNYAASVDPPATRQKLVELEAKLEAQKRVMSLS